MKRDLLCPACAAEALARPPEPRFGEIYIAGTVRLPRPPANIVLESSAGREEIDCPVCVCDYCSRELPQGAKAIARSIFRRGSYLPWEAEYLDHTVQIERAP